MHYQGMMIYPRNFMRIDVDREPREAFDLTKVDIEAIAHALSHICRYGGHSPRYYSVAEHCVHVAGFFSTPHFRKFALLHDCEEALIGDVIRPLRSLISIDSERVDVFADELRKAIFRRLTGDVPGSFLWDNICVVDNDLCAGELAALFGDDCPPHAVPSTTPRTPAVGLQFWSPEDAKERFLAMWRDITEGDEA